MARKPDVEYINNFYVHGSEAKVIEFKTDRRTPKTTLPKPLREKKMTVLVDPVALFGLAVAVVMFVVMAVGLVDYRAACLEKQEMESYLSQLQDDNIMLKHNYRNSYDVNTVRETALALGMVAASEVPTIVIDSEIPESKAEDTWWDTLKWQLSLLFADA